MRKIFSGGLACLLSTTVIVAALMAQEPVLAPVPEPDNAATQNGATSSDVQYISEGEVICYDDGNGKKCHFVKHRPDYRRCYCRPEPFGRNDCRDQYYFAQQGYGVPVTVPIAPVVCKQYNYGWGLPASRLTHIPSGWQTYRPNAPARGRRANGLPMAYWPNDTMQQGAYYMKTPW